MEPKKILSVDLNYSNHVINELSVVGAALIPKDPTLHTEKLKLQLGLGVFFVPRRKCSWFWRELQQVLNKAQQGCRDWWDKVENATSHFQSVLLT